MMASFLVTGVIISGYLITRQPKKYNQKASLMNVLFLLPLISSPLVILTASRSAWISAFISIVLLLPYQYRFAPKNAFFVWIGSLLGGCILGITLLLNSGQPGKLDMQWQNDNIVAQSFPQSIDMLIEKPFTGYGYGTFESSYILYTARQHQLNNDYPAGVPALTHPHNELLYWGVEGGMLPVLGIILAALFVLLRIKSARKGTRLASLALLLPIAIQGQVDYPLYKSAIHWLAFVLILFWVEQRVAKYRYISITRLTATIVKVTTLLLPLVIGYFAFNILHNNVVLNRAEQAPHYDNRLLKTVRHPYVWKERYHWDRYYPPFREGITTQNPERLEPYINWSLTVIKHKPRPEIYTHLIQGYLVMGETSKAEQTRAEAQFLFPSLEFHSVESPVP